jgi:hypothetical protein
LPGLHLGNRDLPMSTSQASPQITSSDAPLTDDERLVLGALMEPDRELHERTVSALAADLRWHWTRAKITLRALEMRRPQLAHPRVGEVFRLKTWFATFDAVDLVQPGRRN